MEQYQPWRRIYAIPQDAAVAPPYLPAPPGPEPVAYICSGASCSPPVTTLAALRKTLG